MRRFAFYLFVVSVCVIVWSAWQFRAPDAAGRYVTFEVRSGQNLKEISRQLRDAGLVRNSLAFEWYVRASRQEQNVQAGTYRLSTGDSLTAIARKLTVGTVPESVTLIEGWTVKEYSSYLAKNGFDGERFKSAVASRGTLADEFAFLAAVPRNASLEGYLFPDTYAMRADRDVPDLVNKMLSTFERKVMPVFTRSKTELTLHEMVTLASIVEQEVAAADDRKKVADIFVRRLALGMPLQSDATIQYLTGSGRSRSTEEDLAIDSPYNTYLNKGLPPGPIGNPGLDAMQAVLAPVENSALYFLTDAEGRVHYAETYEQHLRNKARYLP